MPTFKAVWNYRNRPNQLQQELNAIGNNYNQVVKRLHSIDDFPNIQSWLALHESARKILLDKVSEIKLKSVKSIRYG